MKGFVRGLVLKPRHKVTWNIECRKTKNKVSLVNGKVHKQSREQIEIRIETMQLTQ